MLFASDVLRSHLDHAFPPNSMFPDATQMAAIRPRTFLGIEVVKSRLFPIRCDCKACQDTGYPTGDSFCCECKGTGGHDIVGMIVPDEPWWGQSSYAPRRRQVLDHDATSVIVFPLAKRFPARFPPSVKVPLRDVAVPIGGRS